MIWNYNLDDINRGYSREDRNYECVICGQSFEQGRIYEMQDGLYDAKGAAAQHQKRQHGSIASYLLAQELSVTGLTEIQRNLLKLILAGESDTSIGQKLGIAQSTVRNHRFKLREREKQARLFVALMDSLNQETQKTIQESDTGTLEEVHLTATMVDERFSITDKEREKTIATYFDESTGALRQFPAKEKKKIIVLGEIMKNFKHDVEYKESEVDRVLRRIYEEDFATLRRALIEYGFMDRSKDCKVYRVKE